MARWGSQAAPPGQLLEATLRALLDWLTAGGTSTPDVVAPSVTGGGGGGGGGLAVTDAAAWTAGVSTFTPGGGTFNDAATALTAGQQGTERLTPNRAVHVNLRNQAGTEVGTSGNPVKVDGSAVVQPTSGNTVIVQATFTRPANTTAYLAGQVVGNTGTAALLTFTSAARVNNGSGYITKVRVAIQCTAGTPITPRMRLWLWTQNSPAAIADGATMNIFHANDATRIGSFTLASLSNEGGSSDTNEAYIDTCKTPFVASGGQANIYGMLETLDAFTPISGAAVLVEIGIEQN